MKALAQRLYAIESSGDFHAHWSLGEFEAEVASAESRHFLWPSERDAEGFVLYRRVLDETWILNIAVAQKGRGLGMRLLGAFCEEQRLQGAATVGLEVRPSNAAALALYRKSGFNHIAERHVYYRDGETAWIMIKDLHDK